MEDNFDKILGNKIKEVFENRDVPYNPEHWEMLIAKKKKDKKRAFLYWRVAGFLLLALLAGGIGTFLFDNSDLKEKVKPEIIDNKNDSLKKDTLKNNKNIFITSESKKDSIGSFESRISQIDSITSKIEVKTKSKKYYKTDAVSKTVITYNNNQNIYNKDSIFEINDLVDSLKINKLTTLNDLLKKNDRLTNNDETKKDTVTENKVIAANEKNLNKDSLNVKKDLIAVLEEQKEKDNENDAVSNSIKIGIGLAPILNYNNVNNNSNIGFSGGVSVEIPISKKFDIYTGVLYTNQKLNLNKSDTYLSAADVVNSDNYSELKSEDAIVKGIEIPVNLKYNFSIDKKKVFVSTGFSSTSYFKENIESNYIVSSRVEVTTQNQVGNNIVTYKTEQTNDKIVSENNSNKFNFANILNVSIGVELPVSKQNQSIIIEPYFKYSLKPVTEQKVDFSSVGVHLRYNFSF
ncbi:outer membrane beta-barrel protein [Lutibacter sp. B1]|uniref:outer membrane beta-barrel protein n=1 Tax=Lutibacter sp. B1 TaxID=2725996 RepID=UPI00145774B9|nr:outer membrane beta-barrel protein [Lutibacter sp. B1]NLP58761.1 PorT family protein [Lutibacter sp. B1]